MSIITLFLNFGFTFQHRIPYNPLLLATSLNLVC